jgi:large subunit ribosomal protein L9
MQVILLERIRRLGQMGDVVTVKDGYARNFLLPHGKALHATPANRERFESEKVTLEAANLEAKSEADGVAKSLDGSSFVMIRQASDTGQLFGSVTTRDVALEIKNAGVNLERRQVMLDKPIKSLGIYELTVTLHPEVECAVSVNVARSADEAERQARGEDILTEEQDEVEETAVAVEEIFEDEELAREAAAEIAEDTGEDAGGAAPPQAESAPEAPADDEPATAEAAGDSSDDAAPETSEKKSKKARKSKDD